MRLAKENKGITLVALVVTIIVIMILSFASAYSISGNIQYSHFMQVKNEMKIMKANVDLWNEKYKDQTYNTILSDLLNHIDETERNDIIDDFNITEEMYNSTFSDAFVDNNLNNVQTIDINNATNDYKYFTGEIIKKYLDIEGVNNDFLINIKTRDVRLAFGWKYQGEWYYTLENFGLINEVESNLVSSVSYTLDYGVNPRNANETDIFLQDLKFYDASNNEVKISKFDIEFTKAGENAKKVRITSSADLVQYNNKDSYKVPVDNLGQYVIKIANIDGEYLQNKENVEDTVDVKIPQVTFDADGGTVNTKTKYVKYEDEYGELPTPTREGYDFLGWNGKNLLNLKGRNVKNAGNYSNTTKRNFAGDGIYVGLSGNNYYSPGNISKYTILDEIANALMVNCSSAGYGVTFDTKVKSNTMYTMSCKNSTAYVRIGFYKRDGTFISFINATRYKVFTTPQDTYWMTICVSAASGYDMNKDLYAYNIQIEEGNVATPFEPYYITSDTTVVQDKNHTLTAKWEKTKLMQWASDANTDFHKESIRNSITEVEFVDLNEKSAPTELNENSCWDVSQSQKKTVLAWLEGTKLYIGGEGGVTANEDSSYLFNEFTNVTKITFGDNFDTSNTQKMEYMFSRCKNLATVDVEHINTSNVTSMRSMFAICNKIKRLDLSTWNTSKVESMYAMFCSWDQKLSDSGINGDTDMKLEEIIFGENFDTTNVTTMRSMFYGLNNLTELDLSSFDTSKVTDMFHMFEACRNLTTIYASDKFITTAVTDSTDMFTMDSKLVGGNGTTYSSSYVDKTYARIDKDGQPGYFTEKTNNN